MSRSITFLTLHLNLFDCILNLNLPNHFTGARTSLTRMQDPHQISRPLAMLTNLPSPKTIHCLAALIKHGQRQCHLGPKITTLGFGALLDLGKTCLAEKVVGVAL
jgi:hypothetical protein